MKALTAGVADLVFPPKCIECGILLVSDTDIPFCKACYSRIRFVQEPFCVRCGVPFESQTGGDHLCSDCISGKQYFTAARSVGIYEDVLLGAVHRFKYSRNLISGQALAKLMVSYEYPLFEPDRFDLIVPVPLHPRRLRQRGFNQTVILAAALAGRFTLPLKVNLLKRNLHTPPQFNLGRNERGPNVKGAFDIKKAQEVEGKRIIVVDDVYTTGSTVRECAKTLLDAGAEEVAILTLARAI